MKLKLELALCLSVGLVLMMAGQMAGAAALIGLSIYALLGLHQAVIAMMVASVLVLLNPGLFPVGGASVSMLRWAVTFSALATVLRLVILPKFGKTIVPVVFLCAFIGYTVVSSNLSGYAPAISNLKIIIFALGAITVLHALLGIKDSERFSREIFTVVSVIILGSFLLWIFLPGVAYKRGFNLSAWGLQGITNQGQVLGMFSSLMVAWLISRIAFAKTNRTFFTYAVTLIGLALLYESRARTGLAALALAGISTFIIILIVKKWRLQYLGAIKVSHLIVGTLLTAVVAGLSGVYLQEGIRSFVFKNGRNGDNIGASFEASRGFRIIQLYNSWIEHPILGQGFGLATEPEDLEVQYDPVFKAVPVSASVEKNFLPMAILQESGILGGILITLFFGSLIIYFIQFCHPGALFVLYTGMYINIGEAVFFSLGGGGLFVFVLMMSGLGLREGQTNKTESAFV